MSMRRRTFVQSLFSLGSGTLLSPLHLKFPRREALTWHNVEDWGIEGQGWSDTARYYDRLPAKAEGVVSEAVWNLSRHSAGMSTRFMTDATEVWVKYTLLSDRLAMPHMPATGVSGVDLYAEDAQGVPRWVSVARPTKTTFEKSLVDGLLSGTKKFTVYLPLYNGVETLSIGVAESATFTPVAPRSAKPILFYGTSIMHGACASRPGMAIPSILSRRLNQPCINLGFSGNGRMQPEVVDLLGELEPSLYAIDCLPNMNAEMVLERALPLVESLRAAHSETPILLVEDRLNTNAVFRPSRAAHHQSNRQALRAVRQQIRNKGISKVHYLAGVDLLGHDGEGATDGSHPSDLGMMRYADAYEPAIRNILGLY